MDNNTGMNTPPNGLINETSPYLLQHAYNPVDWYPWGDGAFQRAVRENKLIFLSIGYSTCHWCHAHKCKYPINKKLTQGCVGFYTKIVL